MNIPKITESLYPDGKMLYGRVNVIVRQALHGRDNIVARPALEVEVIYANNGEPIPLKASIPGVMIDAEEAKMLALAITQAIGIAETQQKLYFNKIIYREERT